MPVVDMPINKASIDRILANADILKAVPYFRSINAVINSKPSCSKCKQRQAAAAQARMYQAVKQTIAVLPKGQIEIIKNILNVDRLVIYNTNPLGATTKKVL